MNNLVLSNGYYLDLTQGGFKPFSTMEIRDGRIHSISSDKTLPDSVDLQGKFVIPGLIDAHIHFFQSGGLFTRPDGLDLRHIKSYEQEFEDIKTSIPNLFKRWLACGVTTVIDDGGPFWNKEVYQMAQQMLAPNVFWAGPLVSTVSREKLDLGDPPIIKADNAEHAKQLVDNCLAQNPHFVKFWFIMQADSFSEDSLIMKAGIEYAVSKGAKVMVHATELETAKRAVEYGAHILVHSVFDSDVDEAFISALVEKGVYYIPTLMVRRGYRDAYRTRLLFSPFEVRWGDPAVISSFRTLMTLTDPEIPEPYRDLRKQYAGPVPELDTYATPNLRRLARAGVKIVTGTDAGNMGTLHGPSLHVEMQIMNEAGMSNIEVLEATTRRIGEMLEQPIGEVKEGNIADLVVLERNPLENILSTREIYSIITKGEYFVPEDLLTPNSVEFPVDLQLNAYNSRDIDSFLSAYHPRVEIFDLHSGELRMQGLEAMRIRYSGLFEKSPTLHAKLQNRMVEGNFVFDQELVSGFQGENMLTAVAIYEIENLLIKRVWFAR